MKRYVSIFKESKLNLNFEKVDRMLFSKIKAKYKNKLLNEEEILNNSDEIINYFYDNHLLSGSGNAFFYTGEVRPSNKGPSMPSTEVKLAQILYNQNKITFSWTPPTWRMGCVVYKQ